jgi:hypothetical protein
VCIQSVTCKVLDLGRERYFLQAWLERVKRLRIISEMNEPLISKHRCTFPARLSACHFGPILAGVGSTSKQDFLQS